MKSLSRVRLFATPWAVAYEALPSVGFSRQGYWSGLSFPFPGDLPDPGLKTRFPTLQADAFTICATREFRISLNPIFFCGHSWHTDTCREGLSVCYWCCYRIRGKGERNESWYHLFLRNPDTVITGNSQSSTLILGTEHWNKHSV